MKERGAETSITQALKPIGWAMDSVWDSQPVRRVREEVEAAAAYDILSGLSVRYPTGPGAKLLREAVKRLAIRQAKRPSISR